MGKREAGRTSASYTNNLEIDEKKISMIRLPEELIAQVSTRIKGMNRKQLQVICYFLTYDGGDNND